MTDWIAYANLWSAFQFVEGTMVPRVLLVGWEAILGLIVFIAARRIRRVWLALLLAFTCAFWTHEFFFRAYVLHVVRIPDADDGDVVGIDRKAVLTLERWIGPVR